MNTTHIIKEITESVAAMESRSAKRYLSRMLESLDHTDRALADQSRKIRNAVEKLLGEVNE